MPWHPIAMTIAAATADAAMLSSHFATPGSQVDLGTHRSTCRGTQPPTRCSSKTIEPVTSPTGTSHDRMHSSSASAMRYYDTVRSPSLLASRSSSPPAHLPRPGDHCVVKGGPLPTAHCRPSLALKPAELQRAKWTGRQPTDWPWNLQKNGEQRTEYTSSINALLKANHHISSAAFP